MRIRVKLYAALAAHLPAGAEENAAEIEVESGTTPGAVLARCRVPPEQAHLVMVNGRYVAPAERDTLALAEGDTVAVWPPVAGG